MNVKGERRKEEGRGKTAGNERKGENLWKKKLKKNHNRFKYMVVRRYF